MRCDPDYRRPACRKGSPGRSYGVLIIASHNGSADVSADNWWPWHCIRCRQNHYRLRLGKMPGVPVVLAARSRWITDRGADVPVFMQFS